MRNCPPVSNFSFSFPPKPTETYAYQTPYTTVLQTLPTVPEPQVPAPSRSTQPSPATHSPPPRTAPLSTVNSPLQENHSAYYSPPLRRCPALAKSPPSHKFSIHPIDSQPSLSFPRTRSGVPSSASSALCCLQILTFDIETYELED